MYMTLSSRKLGKAGQEAVGQDLQANSQDLDLLSWVPPLSIFSALSPSFWFSLIPTLASRAHILPREKFPDYLLLSKA